MVVNGFVSPLFSFADTAYAVRPLCRFATSPRTAGSHPLYKGGFLGGGGLHAPLLLAEDAAAVVLAVEAVFMGKFDGTLVAAPFLEI